MRRGIAGLLGMATCVAASAPEGTASAQATGGAGARADVIRVEPRGSSGAYLFLVTVRSPDTGCDQYADWWEVVTPTGELVYRRVLEHSHAKEQPFARSGGPVHVEEDQEVIVRAHMNRSGYGGAALRGSPLEGFAAATLPRDFAQGLAKVEPLPKGCRF